MYRSHALKRARVGSLERNEVTITLRRPITLFSIDCRMHRNVLGRLRLRRLRVVVKAADRQVRSVSLAA